MSQTAVPLLFTALWPLSASPTETHQGGDVGIGPYIERLYIRNVCMFCTQDGHHHVSSQNLYGSPGYEVEGGEDVPGVDQRVTRGCVGGLELHGQRPEAALSGAFKSLTVLQQRPVQMEADIRLETLWETFQHLAGGGSEGAEEGRRQGQARNER